MPAITIAGDRHAEDEADEEDDDQRRVQSTASSTWNDSSLPNSRAHVALRDEDEMREEERRGPSGSRGTPPLLQLRTGVSWSQAKRVARAEPRHGGEGDAGGPRCRRAARAARGGGRSWNASTAISRRRSTSPAPRAYPHHHVARELLDPDDRVVEQIARHHVREHEHSHRRHQRDDQPAVRGHQPSTAPSACSRFISPESRLYFLRWRLLPEPPIPEPRTGLPAVLGVIFGVIWTTLAIDPWHRDGWALECPGSRLRALRSAVPSGSPVSRLYRSFSSSACTRSGRTTPMPRCRTTRGSRRSPERRSTACSAGSATISTG